MLLISDQWTQTVAWPETIAVQLWWVYRRVVLNK